MAIDFAKPATTDNYSSAFVPNIQANQIALAQMLDSSITTITGTPPTNAKRYNRTSSAVEEYNGSTWAPIQFHGLSFNSGNLGVGGAPATRFHVQGASAVVQVGASGDNTSHSFAVQDNGGARFYLGIDNSSGSFFSAGAFGRSIYSEGAFPLLFTVNSLERMRIDASGNVGIGAASPTVRVQADVSNPPRGIVALIRNTAAATQTGAQLHFSQNAIADWAIGQPAGTNAFAFWTGRSAAVDGTELMRIDASGNVGIGTATTSGAKLTVAGGNGILVNGSGAAGYNVVQATNDTAKTLAFGVGGSTAAGWSQNAAHLGTSTNDPLIFGTNGTERVRIDTSGNVGIGATPTLGRLDVAGSIRSTTGINVTGSGGFFNAANKFGLDVNSSTTRFYASGPDSSNRGAYEFHVTDSVGSLDLIALRLGATGAMTLPAQPGFSAFTTSAFTVGTGGSFTDVIYGTEDYDNGGCYDASTGIFTAPVAGKYLVTFSITPQWVAGAITDVFQAQMTKNGASLGGRASCFIPRPGATSTTQIDRPWLYSDTYTLAAGDTLKWRASHGGASTLCSGLSALFSVTLKH